MPYEDRLLFTVTYSGKDYLDSVEIEEMTPRDLVLSVIEAHGGSATLRAINSALMMRRSEVTRYLEALRRLDYINFGRLTNLETVRPGSEDTDYFDEEGMQPRSRRDKNPDAQGRYPVSVDFTEGPYPDREYQ